jgi:hypothetical protein
MGVGILSREGKRVGILSREEKRAVSPFFLQHLDGEEGCILSGKEVPSPLVGEG